MPAAAAALSRNVRTLASTLPRSLSACSVSPYPVLRHACLGHARPPSSACLWTGTDARKAPGCGDSDTALSRRHHRRLCRWGEGPGPVCGHWGPEACPRAYALPSCPEPAAHAPAAALARLPCGPVLSCIGTHGRLSSAAEPAGSRPALSAGQKEFSPLILAGLVAGGVTCLALVANQGESLAELQVPPVRWCRQSLVQPAHLFALWAICKTCLVCILGRVPPAI